MDIGHRSLPALPSPTNGLAIDDLRRRHLRRKSLVTLLLILGTAFSAAMTIWAYGQEIWEQLAISPVGNLISAQPMEQTGISVAPSSQFPLPSTLPAGSVHANLGGAHSAFARTPATNRTSTALPALAHGSPADMGRQQAVRRAVRSATVTVAAVSDDPAPNTLAIQREWLPILQIAAVVLMALAMLLLGIGIRWELRSNSPSQ